MTSHDVVEWARKLLGRGRAGKVGHLGTLDPAAAGVLPLALGKATRLSRFLEETEKTYVFEATFGLETDTLDAEGRVIREGDCEVSLSQLQAALPRFQGAIQQTPPSFSAVHCQGRRAYELARQGQSVTLPSRQVVIHDLALLRFHPGPRPTALLRVTCSKGTYIRSLCADIAAAVGCGAHVSFLLREGVGPFRLEKTWTREEIEEEGLARALLPLDEPLTHLPEVWLEEEQARRFCQGSSIEVGLAAEGCSRVYAQPTREMIGIGRQVDAALQPEVVLASSA